MKILENLVLQEGDNYLKRNGQMGILELIDHITKKYPHLHRFLFQKNRHCNASNQLEDTLFEIVERRFGHHAYILRKTA